MKIKIIIPVATDKWNREVLELCKNVASGETEISVTNIKKGPLSIESEYDEAFVNPYVIETAKMAEREGYDGVIIYCFGNPGLYAVREALKIPVIGIGEAAQIFGMVVGERFGIISTVKNSIARHWRKAKVLGTESKLKTIKPLNLPVLEYGDKEKVLKISKEIAMEMIEMDSVDAIILGCGSMLGIKDKLKKLLPVPVIIPGEAAVKLIESLVKIGISHSKVTYMYPPEKEHL
ncbi:MAG: allantoin racemase [Thermosediminibacterales bacterium]|jgi:allantoin racemase|nr:allantoin racemase [Thermosediminibacterales bacterium]